jgi:hypothetical protein
MATGNKATTSNYDLGGDDLAVAWNNPWEKMTKLCVALHHLIHIVVSANGSHHNSFWFSYLPS